jgi:dTDP-4-dehydrorhamnose reductase
MKKILILGGKGFIGSAIANALRGRATLVLGMRVASNLEQASLEIRMHEMVEASDWLPVIVPFDIVINTIGILREKNGERYEDVHTRSVRALAMACAERKVKLVHISALGLSAGAKSRFIRSKYWGEQAILKNATHAAIVRTPLMDGEGGYGAKWFRLVAKWPVHFVMNTQGNVSPLQVVDLGEAVANISLDEDMDKVAIVELGGEYVLSVAEYLQLLRKSVGLAPAIQLKLPAWLVRMVSHAFDLLDWTPLSFGHYES